MPPHRPNTPISAASSFSCDPCSSSGPPPSAPPLPFAGRGPATPPEDPPSPTPSPPVELSAFFASISAFLEGDYLNERTLTLAQVSPARLERFQRWALNRRLHRLRYIYDAATRTLTLRGMITTVHDAIIQWLMEIYSKLSLSDEERAHIQFNTGYDIPLQGGGIRQPDASFRYVFIDEKEGVEVTDPYPRVIFEVAFSQKHDDVKCVAESWLKGTKGMVSVVVVVNIEEGGKRNGTGDADESVNRMDQDGDGEDQAEESTESEAESEDFTSAQVIANFHKRCNPSDVVGPLTATVELFRLREDGNMRFLPDQSPEVDPVLKISDLLRDTKDGDRRTVALPLARYG
ncbi:uncharacterized protein LAJ45_10343 [Morchella importuna]|uniref:uncharacterized protein n=1 Tax=Morchella importuna TaxID=1174673 RepID=UPI001E8CE956|nr:uncharacterized protein LAJ45_10343 [Morchella importuna]KAH8145703.1 hypothetical protein LAJ45_10343 [Morchella importuna]